jgi:UDP-2-acetamido-2,6-beta-L-arabino-hexul-4-ose reductase
MVAKADAIVHLAGENRSDDVADFALVNTELTRTLCKTIRATGRNIPLILASSTQAELDNPYGKSKLAAEQLVEAFVAETANSTVIYRFPGVFGKWCKPNYNSVVATFCHNIARGLPIQINDAAVTLQLVYIDDAVDELLRALDSAKPGLLRGEINQTYSITLGQLGEQISSFQNCRTSLISERVGTGLTRALYSTYIGYLSPEQFAYDLPQYGDDRGVFVEMLKTPDCGQFSFFTVHPGITRGSHYHHSKTEKFLVVKGIARMRFRHIITGETTDIKVSSDKPQVVDTIPGWVHDITNIGDSEAIIMLWANEIFDRQRPDCIPCEFN